MQKKTTKAKIEELQPDYEQQITTLVVPLKAFYLAEDYHQDYEKKNPYQPYVVNVSKPKIDRVASKFKHLLKEQ